jgi:hypothetical protein
MEAAVGHLQRCEYAFVQELAKSLAGGWGVTWLA